MNSKKTFTLFFLGILLLSIVSAQTTKKESLWENTKNFYKESVKFLNEDVKPATTETTKNIFGFNGSVWRIIPDLIVGWIAGLILFLTYFIISWKRKIVDLKTSNKDDVELTESRTRWLNFIAGRIWKVAFIGIAFALLMQIPLINTILKIITLEVFSYSFTTRAFILAVVLGYLPSIIEHYHKQMLINKLQKKANQARVASAGIR